MNPPFPHYPTTPDSVVESAAGVLLSAGQVDNTRTTAVREAREAQANVGGDLEIPMAEIPPPIDAGADGLKQSAKFTAGALSKFSLAIGDYDTGIDGLNLKWAALPKNAPKDEREELRKRLINQEADLSAELDSEANVVAGMLERGPNDKDIKTLQSQGVMPTDDLQLGPQVEAPPVVKVGDEYVVMGSDQSDHVQVVQNDDGSLTVRVGTLVNGAMTYKTTRIPPGQNNLEIRTYGGNDAIEVPPEVQLNIRAFAGSGDDVYFGGGHPGMSAGSSGDDYIDLGEGDDVAYGGDGNDTIVGGDGNDVIDGQDGNDTIVGADGNDTLYGGRGNDVISGGEGQDYGEGGSGHDEVRGGAGDDTLSGGRGEDLLYGGDGNDHLFGGRGEDVYDGGAGRDDVTAEKGESTHNTENTTIIELIGAPGAQAIELYKPDWMTDDQYEAWLERIDSDLELLRTTPSGREGLVALDDASGETDSIWNPFDEPTKIRIAPYVDGDNPDATDGFDVESWLSGDDLGGNYASPPGGAYDDSALVNYGPTHDEALDERPPVASLYHELSHSFDQLSGGTADGEYTELLVDEDGNVISENDAPYAEINSVGIDTDGDGEYDTLLTGDGSEHPGALTENALREDLGWDNRESYTVVPGEGEDVVVIFEDSDGNEHRVTIPD
ncbi:M91 family zinc metallopeptidase [Nocardioidaceae bacterium SCSIO 66511]|nr:M91 family zinc metallopeptidase [Nocardioidaceae bacterium SCSIO 66511]